MAKVNFKKIEIGYMIEKCLQSMVVFGCGEVLAQYMDGTLVNQDKILKMMVWGGVIYTPIGHVWYTMLDKWILGNAWKSVVKKIVADQLLFTPPLMFGFFYTMQRFKHENHENSKIVAKRKVPETLMVNYVVWPVIHTITFGVVPLQRRILFISMASIGWSSYLSLQSRGL